MALYQLVPVGNILKNRAIHPFAVHQINKLLEFIKRISNLDKGEASQGFHSLGCVQNPSLEQDPRGR